MPPRIKIVRTDSELECPHLDKALLATGANLVLLPGDVSDTELLDQTRDTHLILMCYTPITAKVIEQAQRLKGIVKYGVGIDAIDIDAAHVNNIPVVNIPEYAEETVAEGAFAMMIALAKKLIPIQTAMQNKSWLSPTQRWMGSDISGKTIGLVGVGKIGKSMARMALGFRVKVLGYDPDVSSEAMATVGVEKIDTLRDMFEQCDFVSVHCVLSKDTYHLIGANELACMKSSAILINVSRGAIIDEDALVQALHNRTIAGVGLDVYSREPLNQTDHPMRSLYAMDNVILSPHLTFFTHEAMQRLEDETLERCLEVLENRPLMVKSKDPRLMAQKSGVIFAA